MDIELERTNHKNRLHYRTKENIKIFAIVFILFILFILSRVLLTFAACVYNYVHEGYTRTWELLYHYDALWYVDIVDNGYQSTPNSGTGYANYAFTQSCCASSRIFYLTVLPPIKSGLWFQMYVHSLQGFWV